MSTVFIKGCRNSAQNRTWALDKIHGAFTRPYSSGTSITNLDLKWANKINYLDI